MSSDHTRADEAIAEFLNSLNKGQYLVFVEAMRRLGGELRIDPAEFEQATFPPLPGLDVEALDDFVVLRLRE